MVESASVTSRRSPWSIRHDNVWLLHRPRTVAADKMPAPPVVELDANGKFVQAWGGDLKRVRLA